MSITLPQELVVEAFKHVLTQNNEMRMRLGTAMTQKVIPVQIPLPTTDSTTIQGTVAPSEQKQQSHSETSVQAIPLKQACTRCGTQVKYSHTGRIAYHKCVNGKYTKSLTGTIKNQKRECPVCKKMFHAPHMAYHIARSHINMNRNGDDNDREKKKRRTEVESSPQPPPAMAVLANVASSSKE